MYMSTSDFRAPLKKDTGFCTQMVKHICMDPAGPHNNEFISETKGVLKQSGIEPLIREKRFIRHGAKEFLKGWLS